MADVDGYYYWWDCPPLAWRIGKFEVFFLSAFPSIYRQTLINCITNICIWVLDISSGSVEIIVSYNPLYIYGREGFDNLKDNGGKNTSYECQYWWSPLVLHSNQPTRLVKKVYDPTFLHFFKIGTSFTKRNVSFLCISLAWWHIGGPGKLKNVTADEHWSFCQTSFFNLF